MALLPLKAAPHRKTRLAGELGPDERIALTSALLDRAVAVLEGVPAIRRITLLTAAPLPGWRHDYARDRGRALNREIEAVRAHLPHGSGLLVLHPDLPLLGRRDIAALLRAARRHGVAVAADRHRTGSNAVALLSGRAFRFRFGRDSLDRHRRQGARIVARPGLMLDIDRADDLLIWRRQAREGLNGAARAVPRYRNGRPR